MAPKLVDTLKQTLSGYTDESGKILRVLVAVSGGADSMALLDAVSQLVEQGILQVTAAHLIHHADSEEALRRAKLVEKYCQTKGIKYVQAVIDQTVLAGLSPEEAMRHKRYRFLEEQRQLTDSDLVLTGHHAGDQVETILQRVIMGTGIYGLQGIPQHRDRIVRPFLRVNKQNLIDYNLARDIPYSDDPRNSDLSVPRNRIRHDLLPLVRNTLNPEVDEAISRLGDWAGEAIEVIEKEISECWEKSLLNFQKGEIVLDLNVILTYFTMIQKYTIVKALKSVASPHLNLSSAEMDRIAEFLSHSRTGTYLEFGSSTRVLRDRDRIVVSCERPAAVWSQIDPGVDQHISELGLTVLWDRVDIHDHPDDNEYIADVRFPDQYKKVLLRYATEGDRFHPLGSRGEKRLYRFLADRKVSRFNKHSTIVLTCDNVILWVAGHRISEKARVSDPDDNCWRITLRPLMGE